jgi:hypothetical protein
MKKRLERGMAFELGFEGEVYRWSSTEKKHEDASK